MKQIKTSMISHLLTIPLALAGLLLAPAISQAAAYTWTSSTGTSTLTDGAGTWSTSSANWIPSGGGTAVVWPNNNDAIIGSGGTPGLIVLSSTPVVDNLTFQAVASGWYTFQSSDLRLGGSSGYISRITVPTGVTADIGNGASSSTYLAQGGGANGLICDGGGTLILSFKGHSTYTGGTWITNGTTVLVYSNSAFYSSASLNLASGTLASYNSSPITFANVVNLNGNFKLGAPSTHNANLTFGTGAWTLSGGSWTITIDTITNTINSAIGQDTSGRGLAFSSLNSGTLTLGYSGTEGYTGPTTINSGALALGASCNLNAASGVVIAAGGTLDVSAQTTWTAGSSASPAITASGMSTPATIKGGTTVALGSRPITLNWDGTDDTMLTVSQGALTMNGNLITINGSSTLAHGTHNIIAVTGGSIALSSTPTVIGTAIASGDQAVVSTNNTTPNYVVVTVSSLPTPALDTLTKSAITNTSATLGATVESANGSSITDYGIVWGTAVNPTTSSNKVQFGTSVTPPSTFTVSAAGLPVATTIYYRGYAVNGNGTGYSTNDTFLTLTNAPTSQASNVQFTNVQGGAMTVNWTRGNGANCIVLVNAGSAVSSDPVGGQAYTADPNFGSGSQIGTGYVVYSGTGTNVTLLALTPGTTYYVAVYEFNGSGGMQNYLTPGVTGSQAAPSAHPVTYYSIAAGSDPTLTGSWWTGNNGTGANPSDFLSGDTFIIQNGHNYAIASGASWFINASNAGTAATIQVNGGGALGFNNSAATVNLYLGGNLIKNGAVTNSGAGSGGGQIYFTSSGSWTGSGDLSSGGSAAKMSVTVNSGVTLDASGITNGFKLGSSNTKGITVNGTLNLGTNTINGNLGASSYFTLGASGTLITANTNASGLPGIFPGFTNLLVQKITLPTTANYVFDGVAAQVTGTNANTVTMPNIVNNLTIVNSAGVTLSQDTTVSNTLALTAGIVTGNVILASTNATISGGSSTAYLNGQLTVPFSTPGGVSFTFPVGTASAYSPISLANFTDSGSDTLTASATAAQDPNQASSSIDGTKYIARYWTLTENGGFVSPTYDFTGTFVSGDIQGGANTASLIVQKWDGSSWASPSTGSYSTSTTVTGTGFTTDFGQFAAGEVASLPVVVATSRSGITNTAATLGATVITNNGSAITGYGIVWGTSPNPTTSSNKVQVGTSLGSFPTAFTTNVTGLPPATPIYYRGYATSASGTGYSTNDTFSTLTNAPTIQASGVGGYSFQNGNVSITWNRGNGAKCIVLVNAGSPVDSNPVDGTTYTANANFGSGSLIGPDNYVVYLGTGTNVTLTGLATGTTYYVAVYELNGSGGSENYLTPPATGSQTTVAQVVTTVTWTGSQDIYWNNTNNWDLLVVPGVGTSAIIPSGLANQPYYSNQMAAASFGSLTSAGTLTIATNGFNCGAVLLNNPGGQAQITINTNGIADVTGNVALTSNSVVAVASSGSLTASGQLIIGANPTGGITSTTPGSYGTVTNNGGTINVGSTILNPGNASVTTSCLFVISGGTNNLGSVVIKRSSAGSGGYSTLGSEGLMIYGGQVTMQGLDAGNGSSGNSFLSAMIAGGIVTNNGSVLISQGSSARGSRVLQTGGLFVVTNLVNPNPTVSGSLNVYSVTGGTNIVGGVALGTATSPGNVYFTNGAVMYVGSQGIGWNSNVTLSATLSGGSLLGATADWTGSAPMQMDTGTETIQAADMNGTAHNITISGLLSGFGGLTKTGNGTLTLNAADTYSGNTLISAGTLALGTSGSLNNSGQITVGSGATYNVQAVSGYTVPATKALGGLGVVLGNVSFASSAILSSGTSTTKGALTFSNGVALTGTAITFDFTSNPSSPDNDSVTVAGILDVSGGGNTVDVVGAGPAGSVYPMFNYGTLVGNLSNLSLTPGAASLGYLTNLTGVTPNMIAYVVTKSVHFPTNDVWVGNAASNVWDSLVTTNWLVNGSLDYFINGDSAIFDNTGQVNSNVVLNVTLLPAATTVNATGDYIFSGSGGIGGSGGITKTNTGRLVIQTTNTFTGGVSINQGVVSVSSLAADNTPSPLGQTGTLLMNGGSLEYTGPGSSWTRLVTVGTNGGGLSLPTGVTLTYSGTISGNGSLTKSGSGSLTLGTPNAYTNGTYLNGGTLVLNDPAAAGSGNIVFTGNSTLSLGAVKPANAIVLSNYGGIIVGGNSGGLTGIKNVTGSSNLLVAVTGSSSVFDLTGNMSTYSGSITFSNAGGAVVRFNGTTGSALATWDLGTGSMDLNIRTGSTSNNIGALEGGSSTTLSGRGGSSNSGATTYYIGANGLNTIFNGVIQNGNGASGSTPSTSSPTSINKIGSGSLALTGASTYTGSTTVGSGTLEVDGSLASGGTVTVNGGTLAGGGTIGGATTLNAGAILSAGSNSVGTLTFSGTLTLDPASTNSFAVTTVGGASNSVSVAGTLTPNSSVIQITSGTALGVGTYTLFNYSGGINGSFNATPVFDVAPAASASIVDTGAGQINLVVGTPTPPSFSSITISGADIILNATGGTPGGSVSVLTSTDLTLPLASWTTVTTGNFDSFGNYSYTVTGALTSGQPQQFYILKQ